MKSRRQISPLLSTRVNAEQIKHCNFFSDGTLLRIGKRGSPWWKYLAAVVITACWSSLAIAEQADIEMGVLTCELAEPPEGAPSNQTAGGQKREGLCTFKPKKGSEETYVASFEGVSISVDRTRTVIWVIKTVAGVATLGPGVLE